MAALVLDDLEKEKQRLIKILQMWERSYDMGTELKMMAETEIYKTKQDLDRVQEKIRKSTKKSLEE